MPEPVVARADKDGDKIDKLFDALNARMDAEAVERKADKARMDSVCGRMDAWDNEKKADAAKKDAEEEKAKKDAAEAEDKAKKDAAKKDADEAEEKVKKDAAAEEEKKEQAKKDAARIAATSDTETRAMIAALEKRMPVEMDEPTRVRFTQSQQSAERVVQAFGDSAGAPRWLNGERLDEYRRRLLTPHKAHSVQWKDVDISAFSDKALDVVETQIYADALRAATSPASVVAGQLRMSVKQDETGRRIRSFHGDPEACWAPFKLPTRAVAGFQTKFN